MWVMEKKVTKQAVQRDEFGSWWIPGYQVKRRFESTT